MLVGADGLNSRLARQIGVARRRGPRRAALVAHATGIAGLCDVGEMHVGATGYAGLAPLGGNLANVALVVDLARGHIRPPLDGALRRHLAAFPTLRHRLDALQLVSPVRAVGPFGRTTTRATADSVLLVGDAADFYDPFTGEGIYAALRGAELAARCVVRALEGAEPRARALARYDRLRRAAFRSKWALERIVSWVVARPGTMTHVARRLGRRADLADQLVSVTAHVAPASRVFRAGFILGLVA
jgi:flavin-dependent dehydrogenase